jgi:hypothetical protein
MAEQRDIKYINRNFTDFRDQLMEYAKAYFPDTYNDFSPTSPGMMFMEMAAYVGDVLSFYQDTQLQETFIQHAKDPANLYTMAYMLGYRPKVTAASEVELEVTQNVVADAPNFTPNYSQALTIAENSTVVASSGNGTTFIIDRPVNFAFSSSYDPTEITVSRISNGNPAEFQLKKKVKAFSGEIKTITRTIGNAERFLTLNIEEDNIIGILDITDSGGGEWYEVPFLGQDTVYLDTDNGSSDSGKVPNLLQLTKVPKRFVTRFTSTGTLQIQFGAGVSENDDATFLPDPRNVGIGTNQGISRLDYAYDPSNFLFSRTYGLAPSNTTLTISYLVGGGVASNEASNTVTTNGAVTVSATDTSYQNTLAFNNPKPAQGGRDGDTVEEIRQNTIRAFNEQGRTVTVEDFNVRALSLPPRYGAIAKTYTIQDQLSNTNSSTDRVLDSNPLSLSMHVLAFDIDGKLETASDSLKANLKTYLSQYMLLTDAINIRDAFVVNIGVKYDIVVLPGSIGRNVLLECNLALRNYLDNRKWSINQPINLSRVYTLLDRVKGVQTVKKIEITNKAGGRYSQYAYDIPGATKENVVYPSLDPCIFEVKFPETDIEGRITTL